MKILIIGSGGQLGTDCVDILQNNYEIVPIDYPQIDLGSRKSVEDVLHASAPEVIINCAAYTAVDKCETEQEAAWKINADGPRYIAACAAAQGSRIIHVSTDYVFDGKKGLPEPYYEGDRVNPLSEYGKSKLAGEQETLKCVPEAIILRTAWLYSAHGANFLKTMLKLALSDPARPFKVVNDQFGSLTWSYTLARQIERLLDSSLTGIFHTTSEGYSSWYEAACYFLAKMAVPHSFVPCTTAEYPTAAHRPTNSILSNTVLERHDLSVFRSWQEDVNLFVSQHKNTLLEEASV
ncbi:MAG: dTDP-4-dehydrorhamnose reductase [Deltaproteobacteria bacterium]|nr:dTDP-4-dehydrorhamnose reductase [Deltaproteobacteria bacterium]